MYGRLTEAHMPFARMLIDYGCPFWPHFSFNEDYWPLSAELCKYAQRAVQRRASARSAAVALIAAVKRVLGHDMARLLGRFVYVTRRGCQVWEPREGE